MPSIRGVRPQNLALMGSLDVGWLVNLTFDREMEFMHLGALEPKTMSCS